MVLHAVRIGLIFEVFISAQCGWLSSRTCFRAVTMGIAFFSLSLTICWVPSSNQDPQLLIFSSSQPWLSPLSLLLWFLFHPPLELSAALSPLCCCHFCHPVFMLPAEPTEARETTDENPFIPLLSLHKGRCRRMCPSKRRCVVRILALIMANFTQIKYCFCGYERCHSPSCK